MSALAAILSPDPRMASDAAALRMMAAMGTRGGEVRSVWRAPGVTLAVARHRWEEGRDFAGPAAVATSGPYAVVADATLYYRADLMRRLAASGVRCASELPSALILAAYEAWGLACAAELEGDFAFVLWDARSRRLVCARDFAGRRPLHHAAEGDTVLAASTIGGVSSHPACPQVLSLPELASVAAGLPPDEEATCLAAVRSVPAGSVISIGQRARAHRAQAWTPPPFVGGSRVSFPDAAETLRDVLGRAVTERMDTSATTSVWMSGGHDSTAVAALATSALATSAPGAGRLAAVSVSYPRGDPGREDGIIEQVGLFLGIPIHWIRSEEIPLLPEPEAGAAHRDEPFAHAFETWNRALARGSRAVGARVALDGMGGDQLFHVSPIRLADLLEDGRLLALSWEVAGGALLGSGHRGLLHWAVAPLLRPGLSRRLGESHRHLDGAVPPWIRREAVRRYGLSERARARPPRRPGESRAAHEARWYLTSPYFPWVFSVQAALALEEGVELRSPLYDPRVIALAASRPVQERARGWEGKRLLRAALRGLLPDAVSAPRRRRTGITSGYFRTGLRTALSGMPREWLTDLRLEALEIVDGAALRRAVADVRADRAAEVVGVGVFLTLQTELWLAARDRARITDQEVSVASGV